mmetsp:Transcript_2500/g.9722  ORF Transcript_2500/g.9722 Transcript_2500/m.9722 type:complete len:203 (-) Transcript_2500:804-1412(-)
MWLGRNTNGEFPPRTYSPPMAQLDGDLTAHHGTTSMPSGSRAAASISSFARRSSASLSASAARASAGSFGFCSASFCAGPTSIGEDVDASSPLVSRSSGTSASASSAMNVTPLVARHSPTLTASSVKISPVAGLAARVSHSLAVSCVISIPHNSQFRLCPGAARTRSEIRRRSLGASSSANANANPTSAPSTHSGSVFGPSQ